ncbi:MAG: S8 family serine peptidase, partial [Dehalococcoidia bacterium]
MNRRGIRLATMALVLGTLVAAAIRVAGQEPPPSEWIVFMDREPPGSTAQSFSLASVIGMETLSAIPAFDVHVIRASQTSAKALERMPGVRRVVPNTQFTIGPAMMAQEDLSTDVSAESPRVRVSPDTHLGKIVVGNQSSMGLRITNVGFTVLSSVSVLLDIVNVPQGAQLTSDEPGPGEYRIELQASGNGQWIALEDGEVDMPPEFVVLIGGQAAPQVRVTLGSPGPAGDYSLAHAVAALDGGGVTAAHVADVPWLIARVRANDVWEHTRGAGVKVAVMDTGIDETWPELTVAGGCNAVDFTFCAATANWDDHGHGTAVASLIGATPANGGIQLTGVAPEAQLYSVKVCKPSGMTATCPFADILQGLSWAVENDIDVVNMSFGTTDLPTGLAMCRAVDTLTATEGIVLVAASGNEVAMNYPAACPGVIAAGGVDADDGLYAGSGRGPEMVTTGIVAPAQQLFMLYRYPAVTVATGTSFASPIV